MFRVIFSSHAARAINQSEITALSLVCRRNNVPLALTGLLVFHENRFFQVIEGEEEPLTKVIGKIVRDPRHRGLQIIHNGPIEKRAFPTWRVGLHLPKDASRLPSSTIGLTDLLPRDSDYRGRDPEVRDQVRRFLASCDNLPRVANG